MHHYHVSRMAGALALAMLAGPAAAATLTVDPTNGPYFTIQSAVNAAAPGDTVLIKPNPNSLGYRENIVVNTANLTLVGDTVAAAANLNTQTCPTVALDGCATPANPSGCRNTVFAVNAANVKLRKVTVRNAYVEFKDGVTAGEVSQSCFLGDAVIDSSQTTQNLVVDRNVVSGGDGRSIQLSGNGHRFTNNRLFNTDDSVYLNGSNFVVSGNVIRGNNDSHCLTVSNFAFSVPGNHLIENNVIAGGQGIAIRLESNAGAGTIVRRNHISGIAGNGIYVQTGNGVQIIDNVIENTRYDGIYIGVSNAIVSGNRMEAAGVDDAQGIEVSGSNNLIENNTISLGGDDAIQLSGSGGHIIRNNTLLRSGNESSGDACVDIESSNNQIIGNTFRFCSLTGVEVNSNDNVIQGNTFTGTGQMAIRLTSGSNSQVTGNTITGNAGIGIAVEGATDVQITGNTVTGNPLDICTGYNSGTGTVSAFTGNAYNTGGDTYTCPWIY